MKKFALKTALVGAALLVSGTAQAGIVSISTGSTATGDRTTNLVTNGSFETGSTGGSQNWTGPGPHSGGSPGGPGVTIPGWTASYDTGAYGWWGPLNFGAAPCADGTNCLYFGNWFTTPSSAPTFNADGTVSFATAPTFTNSSSTNAAPVVLSQTLTGLTVGDTYLLDFWTTGEDNIGGFNNPGIFGLDIGSDSVFLTVPSLNSLFPSGTLRYFVTFTADSSSVALSFTNWGHVSGDATELMLDDVIVNGRSEPIPEPASFALLGLGMLALAGSRRRQHKAA